MRILLVNKFLYPRGGAETYVIKLGKYLETQGHDVEYFGMYDDKNILGNSANQYTSNMDFHNAGIEKLLYPLKIIYSIEAKRKMKRVIKNFRPDVIHLNNINFQLTPSIIDISHKMGIPIVQTVHDYQMICPNHLLFNPNNKKICEKCIYGSKWNCAKNNCIHGSKMKSIIGSIEGILYTKLKKSYQKIDKFICPSIFLENKLHESSNIYKGKTVSIHNFIEFKDLNNYKKEDYVLFFGRLSEEKGVKIFLEICIECPNIKFKIAGTGPLENCCKNIENVEFLGFKSGQDLEEIIAKAKFSVYPSIWYENCPLSILESESLGTPVMTADYGGMKELVEEGETGKLVRNILDKEEFKAEILNLYKNDILLDNMSKKCLEKRNEMINLKEYGDRILKIYYEVRRNSNE